MAEPLLSAVDLVVSWDPEIGTVSFTSFSPGPAGTSMIPFRDAEVDLDAASFGQFSSLTMTGVDAPDGLDAHGPLLGRLVEPTRRARIQEALPQCVDGPRRFLSSETVRFDRRGRGVAQERWGRLAMALDQAASPGLLGPERDLQVLEASMVAADLGVLDLVLDLRSRRDRALADLAVLPFGELQRLDESTAGAARDVLREVIARVGAAAPPRLETAVLLLAPEITEPLKEYVWRQVAASPPSGPRDGAIHEQKARYFDGLRTRIEDLHSMNVITLGPELDVTNTSGDEHLAVLEFHGRRADGWWLRAFVGGCTAPVAIAPFVQTSSGDAEARLLLPPSVSGVDSWDIVGDPAERRPSPEMSSYLGAFALGKAAARHERLTDGDASADLWDACSQLHAAAGDETRSNDAADRVGITRRLAGGPLRQRGRERFPDVGPLVTDRALPRYSPADPNKRFRRR